MCVLDMVNGGLYGGRHRNLKARHEDLLGGNRGRKGGLQVLVGVTAQETDILIQVVGKSTNRLF